jgi:hypothetical protein
MAKVTLTQDDGSTQDFFDQAHVDAAVSEALANVPAPVAVDPEAVEIDLVLTDGTTRKFVPAQ